MAQASVIEMFMGRLKEAEVSQETKALAELFAKDAKLENLTRPLTAKQRNVVADSPEQFWRQYLKAFDHVESKFTRTRDDGRFAVLEWHTTGVLAMGLPVHYAGVSILEYEGNQIKYFRTYYDSAAFLCHLLHPDGQSKTAGLPDMSAEVSS